MGKHLRANRKSHDPAQEYVVIVGAPSNTFNGYLNDQTGDPQPAPADSSDAEIRKYIKGPDVTTHDLYWADFLYSALKLVETRRIQPDPGDILTFLIYLPPYDLRAARDWDASPYNLQLHRSSPWVAGKDPYDPLFKLGDQAAVKPKPRPSEPNHTTTPPPPASKSEPDIDHEILMRTTSEFETNPDGTPVIGPDGRPVYLFDGGFPKRARGGGGYHQIYEVVPRIIMGTKWSGTAAPNTPPLRRVQVKALYFDDPTQMFAYVENGSWSGSQYVLVPPTEDWQNPDPPPYNWVAGVQPNVMYDSWKKTPAVDRTRVKIRRLDYFGHSSPVSLPAGDFDALFLRYGWGNKKGEIPQGEVLVTSGDWQTHLSKKLFTKDAIAWLWGCNLSEHMAPMLADVVGDYVMACLGRTSYDFILQDYDSMPEPADPSYGFQRFLGGF